MTKITILGGGESGTGAAILAKQKGYEVFLSDKGPIAEKYKTLLEKYSIDFEEHQHTEEKIFDADEIVKSPGIPDHVTLITKLKALRIPIISEIELAIRHTDKPIIAITGTNGKTTTTMLIHHLLTHAGISAGLVGNIGYSFAKQVAEEEVDYWVLEISSFQLDDCQSLKPYIALILNITPDHLDRYNNDINEYADAKFKITQHQSSSDFLIYSDFDPIVSNKVLQVDHVTLLKVCRDNDSKKAAFYKDGYLKASYENHFFSLEASALQIKGPHNIKNALFAVQVGMVLQLSNESIEKGLRTFKGVPHRMEHIDQIDGVTYINDSKGTNIDATFWALSSFVNLDTEVVWIVGGVDKGNDYATLDDVVSNVKHIIALGVDNTKIIQHYQGQIPITEAGSMQEAIRASQRISNQGDTVLLSPACASFDLFDNYEDRGHQFVQMVKELKK